MTASEKLEKCANDLIVEQPYLADISCLIIKKECFGGFMKECPTLAVTVFKNQYFLFYSTKFVEKTEPDILKRLLVHEYMHLMLAHLYRWKKFYDSGIKPEILNIAFDAALNQHIKRMPSWGVFPSTIKAPENLTGEQYVEHMLNNFLKNIKGEASGGSGSGNGSSGSGSKGDPVKDCCDELTDERNGSHELWKHIDEKDSQIAKEAMKQACSRAVSKMAGNVPGELIKEIQEAWETPINWRGALKYFHQSVITSIREYSVSVRDRRRGLNIPGSRKTMECRVLVAIDNSGSMSDDDLTHVISECRMLGVTLNIEADVLQFDCGIQMFQPIKEFVKRKEFKGRGGTSFQEPFDFMQDRMFRRETFKQLGIKPKNVKYDGLIIYTDGYASPPIINKKFKILWLVTPGNHKPEGSPGIEIEVKIEKEIK